MAIRFFGRACAALLVSAVASAPLLANQPVPLREVFPIGYHYHVSSRVELTGGLTLPPEKDQPARTLAVTGTSSIDYDERVLSLEKDGRVGKTVRSYRQITFQRKVGTQDQQNTLRPAVRRLVVLRQNQIEVPFSPDGPLTWNEMDLIRTDVFTPALTGLLPAAAVKPGDQWQAAVVAVQELTDLEKIDEGGIVCKLEPLTVVGQRRQARVTFSGTVRGLGEDGPNRQRLDGYFYFDLESNHLSYLFLKGVQELLDKDGKVLGKIEGTFVLTRQPQPFCKELTNQALTGVALDPNDSNTLLLYDNPELGVRLLHPRHWRVAGVRGRQVALDENRGSGLLLTVEPLKKTPTAAQYLQEVQAWVQKEKAKVQGASPVRVVQGQPLGLEHFALQIEANKQVAIMDYYVLRQAAGGATVASRVIPAHAKEVRADVERMLRGAVLSAPQP
jgi:hypothetical protein